MNIQAGEIYGKQRASKFVLYCVIKVKRNKHLTQKLVTLQNIDNPLSLLETTDQNLSQLGYIRVSQTPYISNNPTKKNKQPTRCPHTLDFVAARADTERPTAPATLALFN
jgi:hypothetical protein